MSDCGTEIRAGLVAIANAIANKSCCAGSTGTGGAGSTGDVASDVETGVPGEHTGEPPVGFASWDAYDAYKCNVATWIVDRLIADLTALASGAWLGSLSTSAALAIFTALVLTPIPGDELLALVGLMIAAAASGVVSAVTTDAAASITAVREDVICALFGAGTVAAARTDALAVVNDAFDADLSALSAGLAKSVVGYFLGWDNLNKLFVYDGSRVYPDSECVCGEEGNIEFVLLTGNNPSYTEVPVAFTKSGNTYSLDPMIATTVDGVGNSIVLQIRRVGDAGPGWVETNILAWSNLAGRNMTVRTPAGATVFYAGTAGWGVTEHNTELDNWNDVGFVQIWETGGDASGVQIELVP